MSVNSRNRTEYEIKRAKRRFAIIFLAAVVTTAGMISFIITKQAVDNMRSKIVNLISSTTNRLGKLSRDETIDRIYSDMYKK